MKRATMLGWALCSTMLVLAACGEDDGGANDDGGGSGASGAGTGGLAGVGAAGEGGTAAGSGGTAGTGGPSEEDLVPFENGSRQHAHVLNLVDEAAAQQVEDFLNDQVHALDGATRKFYEYYGDDYDFLIFVPDHALGSQISAVYESVRDPAIPGTGLTGEAPHLEYYSAERLVGAIATDYTSPSFPALHHELAHRWANHLDPSFGFGKDGSYDLGTHWGLTSVFGQLGGFDESTIRCETPANAMPPNCTALPSGRTRYVFSDFGSNTNSFQSVPYAPLELYLMGLLPRSEVPDTYMLLVDGATDYSTVGDQDGLVTVEAASIGEIKLDDIVALHGERVPTPEAERHFTSAFVVVSRTPASDSVMAEVERWSEIFGNHTSGPWDSFEAATGGRATLETRIGARRRKDDPLVVPDLTHLLPGAACDVIAQDCPGGQACRNFEDPYCQAAGSGVLDDPCQVDVDCAAGLTCNDGACLPLCTLEPDSDKNCNVLCGERLVAYYTDQAQTRYLGGVCWH